ncbi:MAG: hypothetical protein WAL29_07050 [Bacteroidales bacterium]
MPKPNPVKPGDDKNKHEENECISSDPQQLHHAAHAYAHVPSVIFTWKFSLLKFIKSFTLLRLSKVLLTPPTPSGRGTETS